MPLDQFGSAETVIVNSWLTDDPARRILPVGRKERYAALLAPYKVFPENPHDVAELCAIEQARFDLARALSARGLWALFLALFFHRLSLPCALSPPLARGRDRPRGGAPPVCAPV